VHGGKAQMANLEPGVIVAALLVEGIGIGGLGGQGYCDAKKGADNKNS